MKKFERQSNYQYSDKKHIRRKKLNFYNFLHSVKKSNESLITNILSQFHVAIFAYLKVMNEKGNAKDNVNLILDTA